MRRLALLLTALAVSSASASAQKNTAPASGRVRVVVDGVAVGLGQSMKNPIALQSDLAYHGSGTDAGGAAPSRILPQKPTPVKIEVDGIAVTSATSPLAVWAGDTQQGRAKPKNVELTLLKADGSPLIRYQLVNALPTQSTTSSLKGGSSAPMVMNVTFTAQGYTQTNMAP